MYKVMVRFRGEAKFEDTFCENEKLDDAKHFADRWKQGIYTHDEDAVSEAAVFDPSGNIVYRSGIEVNRHA